MLITERVDAVALLIGQMVTMGVPEVLDRPRPRHWKQRGLRWGWTAVMWLAHMLTEGAHRQGAGAASIKGLQPTLSRLTAQAREPLDCSDDRRGHLLQHVSTPTSWHQIARDVNARSIAVYALPQEVSRCEATTVSGQHDVPAGGLWQFGQSKDEPTRPQIKGMRGALDPVGLPLATEVRSGARAEEGLDMPVSDRLRAGLSQSGVLFVGAGTRSALDTRAPSAGPPHGYGSPWPFTGATAEAMEAWIPEGVATGQAGELERLCRTHDRGQEGRAADGSEFARTGGAQGGAAAWTARVVVRRSPLQATQQAAGVATRLGHAEQPRAA